MRLRYVAIEEMMRTGMSNDQIIEKLQINFTGKTDQSNNLGTHFCPFLTVCYGAFALFVMLLAEEERDSSRNLGGYRPV